LVIAHRGASGYRPENTVSAFELAIDQRADMIEIDLHRSRDGAIAIRHDEHLTSLGCDREISATDLAEIRKLDAGGGQTVPILEEVLDRFGRQIAFNLELKRGSGGCYPGLEADALEAVESRGLLGSTLFSSFDDEALERLRALSSAARLALLISPRRPQHALDRARAIGAESINPQLDLAAPALIEAAHADGLAILVYTVNELDDMLRLLTAGVDGLFTNYPDRLRALLETSRGKVETDV
jgi:glycerophosphoryl diester phosphodiesterase